MCKVPTVGVNAPVMLTFFFADVHCMRQRQSQENDATVLDEVALGNHSSSCYGTEADDPTLSLCP